MLYYTQVAWLAQYSISDRRTFYKNNHHTAHPKKKKEKNQLQRLCIYAQEYNTLSGRWLHYMEIKQYK